MLKRVSTSVLATIATIAAMLPAQAASVLPSDIETTFGDAQTDIVKVIGLAMGLVLTLVVWRYVRSAAK